MRLWRIGRPTLRIASSLGVEWAASNVSANARLVPQWMLVGGGLVALRLPPGRCPGVREQGLPAVRDAMPVQSRCDRSKQQNTDRELVAIPTWTPTSGPESETSVSGATKCESRVKLCGSLCSVIAGHEG